MNKLSRAADLPQSHTALAGEVGIGARADLHLEAREGDGDGGGGHVSTKEGFCCS